MKKEAEAKTDSVAVAPPTVEVSLKEGDALTVLRGMPDKSVDSIVCSPPYWGLRLYKTAPQVWGGKATCRHRWGDTVPGSKRGGSGTPTNKNGRGEEYGRSAEKGAFCQKCGAWIGELGQEPTPNLFVEHLCLIFDEAKRVLKDRGTCWINLGDTYASDWPCRRPNKIGAGSLEDGTRYSRPARMGDGAKPKDLVGIPFRFALAMQLRGWWWRSCVPWVKRQSMPESVRDRPTTAVEYWLFFSKQEKYYYDYDAVSRKAASVSVARYEMQYISARAHGNEKKVTKKGDKEKRAFRNSDLFFESLQIPHGAVTNEEGAILALDVGNKGTSVDHFATYPEKLIAPLILSSCPEGGTVVDLFAGSGTTGIVAAKFCRNAILIELSTHYQKIIKKRIAGIAPPLFSMEGVK